MPPKKQVQFKEENYTEKQTDSDEEEYYSSSGTSSEDDSDDDRQNSAALKQFYKGKNNSQIQHDKQLIQENKKINLNYVDHKLESSLNTKVSNALKTSQNKIDEDRLRTKDKNDRATVD